MKKTSFKTIYTLIVIIVFFSICHLTEARTIDMQKTLSHNQLLTFSYDKLNTIIHTYFITFELTTIDGTNTPTSTEISFKPGLQMPQEKFTLTAEHPTNEIKLYLDPEKANINLDSKDTLSVRIGSNNDKNTVVNITISNEWLGYSHLASTYVNEYHGNITKNTLEYTVTDAHLYDYFMGWSMAMPSDGWLENQVLVDNVEVFKNRLVQYDGDFGVFQIPNLKNGSSITFNLSMDAPGMGAGRMHLYKKAKPFKMKITPLYTHIGDNTQVELSVNSDGDATSYGVIFNQDTGQEYIKIPSKKFPSNIQINLNKDEGTFNIASKVVNNKGETLIHGNTVTISKANIIEQLYSFSLTKPSKNAVYIISDIDRYIENNEINRSMVSSIKEYGLNLFFVVNNVPEVLRPLLTNSV